MVERSISCSYLCGRPMNGCKNHEQMAASHLHTRHRSKFLPPQRVLEITELSPEEEAVEKFLRKNLKAILKLRGEVERVSSSAEYVGDPGTKRDGSASEPKLLACRRPSVRPRPFPPPYSPTQQEPASHSGCPCALPRPCCSLPPSLPRSLPPSGEHGLRTPLGTCYM